MTLQVVKGTAPFAEPEFLLSDHRTTQGITIDADLVRIGQYVANQKILKAGTPMGKVTATGLFGPAKKTTLKSVANAGQKAVELTDARFFQVGDTIVVGTEAAQAIAAIDYSTGVATMTNNLAGQQAAGVTVKEDNGLETAAGILTQSVDLTDGDVAAAIVTHAVVKSARIHGVNALIKADLPLIQFR